MRRRRYVNEDAFWKDNLILRRRRCTIEGERRAFYRYVCKTGWFSPMIKVPREGFLGWFLTSDEHWCYVRPRCEQYKFGYPVFSIVNFLPTQAWRETTVERCWRVKSDEAFDEAHRIHDSRMQALATGVKLAEWRHKQRTTFVMLNKSNTYHRIFAANFRGSNLSVEDVPTSVLKLCKALTALRTAIRKKRKTTSS